MNISELNYILKTLELRIDNESKELLLNYADKRGLDANELQDDIVKTGIQKLLATRAPRFLHSSALSFHEFLLIVKRNGFSLNLDHAEMREMYEIFMSMHRENTRNMDRSTVGMIFKGAKKYMIANTDRFVDFSKVKELIKTHQSETDLRLYNAFYKIDKKFKEINLLDEKLPVDTLIKQCYQKAQQVCAELNVEENNLADDVVNIVWSLACIYNSLVNYTADISKTSSSRLSIYAEKLLQERILTKGTLFYKNLLNNYPDIEFEKTQMFYFDEFLNMLMNDPNVSKDELFNEQDIYNLINHTPYLVFAASKEKLEGARYALNLYIESVLKEFPKVKRKTTKDIFKKAGSILDNSPIANENAAWLLLGEDVGTILKHNLGKDKDLSKKNSLKQEYMQKAFENLHISGMDLNKHSFVLNNRNSIFSTLRIDNMYDCISNVLTLTCEALGIEEEYLSNKRIALMRLGFNVEEMFTGDNIFDIFDVSSKFISLTKEKREEFENYKQNIKQLSSLISMPNILKIVQHNFKFLTQNNTKDFEKLIKESKTKEELLEKLIAFINSKTNGSSKTQSARSQSKVEGKFTKLQKSKIEIDELNINFELLKELGFECNFGEVAKEKQKKSASQKSKKNPIDSDTINGLNKLENDINNIDEDLVPIYSEEESLQDEDDVEPEIDSPYDDWAKLQFEMSAIAEYFKNIKPLDTSKIGWYAKEGKKNTHPEDTSWLKDYPTYKGTIIYDLLERDTSQFVSTFALPEGKTTLRVINKNLNELFAKILSVKNEIKIDTTTVDDTIEFLDVIIESKEADKKMLIDEMVLNTGAGGEINALDQPKYINILLQRLQEIEKTAKKSKIPGLIDSIVSKKKELENSKMAAENNSMSSYNLHIEGKQSVTHTIEEYARLSKLIEALETIKESFVKFKANLNKVEEVKETSAQDDATIKRILELKQKIEEANQSLAKKERQAESLKSSIRSTAKDLLAKVLGQIENKKTKIEEYNKELQALIDTLPADKRDNFDL